MRTDSQADRQLSYGLPANDRVIGRGVCVPSPDLEYIVVANAEDWLYVSGLSGGAHQMLGVWAERDLPEWSPDGKRLAVIGSDIAKQREQLYLYVFGIESGKPHLIARFPARSGNLVWSPSSDRICFREANSEDYIVGDISTKTTTRIFAPGSRHATVGFIDKSGNPRPFPRGWSALFEFFTPVTWLPGDRIVGAILVNVPNADYSWSFPAIADWNTRSVTMLGDQRIVNEDSIVGFDAANQRLYCFFTKNTDLGAGGFTGSIPGWLSLNRKPMYHLLHLPGYYDVSSAQGKKLAGDDSQSWYLVSRDGFYVMNIPYGPSSISGNGRWLALWEQRFGKEKDGFRNAAARIVIWDVSGSPKVQRVIEAEKKHNPALFKLLNNPRKFSFTTDNSSLIVWFLDGPVVRFRLNAE